jgi:hypothetical protein
MGREARAARLAERRLRAILVLALGTLHTERLPSPDRGRLSGTTRHGIRAAAGVGAPAVLWGTGAPTLPRPGLGRQMGSSGAWLALEAVGRPIGGADESEPHVYAMLLTATRRPGAWVPPRLNRQWNRLTELP